MAYQKHYKYKGITLLEAYFRIGKYSFDRVSCQGIFTIFIYSDKNARLVNPSDHIDELPYYTINKHMTEAECYEHALTVMDTPTGELDQNNEAVMVSFFADAEVV
jgi:hypothetical protein